MAAQRGASGVEKKKRSKKRGKRTEGTSTACKNKKGETKRVEADNCTVSSSSESDSDVPSEKVTAVEEDFSVSHSKVKNNEKKRELGVDYWPKGSIASPSSTC